jgi:hypothetical protein
MQLDSSYASLWKEFDSNFYMSLSIRQLQLKNGQEPLSFSVKFIWLKGIPFGLNKNHDKHYCRREATSLIWVLHVTLHYTYGIYQLTPWPLVRKRTIQTDRPPLVGEVSANFRG